ALPCLRAEARRHSEGEGARRGRRCAALPLRRQDRGRREEIRVRPRYRLADALLHQPCTDSRLPNPLRRFDPATRRHRPPRRRRDRQRQGRPGSRARATARAALMQSRPACREPAGCSTMIRSVVVMCAALGIGAAAGATNWNDAHAANPFLPGYFADPSIIEHEGRHYLYATIDPWGGERLACWVSDDFRDWTYHELNWPTKTACASAEWSGAMVWAPSVARGVDGRVYRYTSAGSENWVGVAEHPLAPWSNAPGDRPLVPPPL